MKSDTRQRFGNAISALRARARLSLRALAAEVGVSASYIHRLEHAVMGPPSPGLITRLAVVLQANESDLLWLAGVLPLETQNQIRAEALRVFGKKLREIRIAAGIPQEELARRVGIHHTYLSKVETGRKPPPSRQVLTMMARLFGVSEDLLITLAGRRRPGTEDRSMFQHPDHS